MVCHCSWQERAKRVLEYKNRSQRSIPAPVNRNRNDFRIFGTAANLLYLTQYYDKERHEPLASVNYLYGNRRDRYVHGMPSLKDAIAVFVP
ncbi:hypothetical protein BOTBODRAFT_27906 [Botryobasidium botryosum FD-172 SS1]|uniref:Uncharacterized protein n=1 Tax=Botryobasidium botryosum (strain FD-172 SS1) TaxID=930990 RepID=A0A067MXD5_BOTB1|nr:hypothetical protein BOTBODRAFT_27906 [Botryobasidium botryosum FD-172 SS1]